MVRVPITEGVFTWPSAVTGQVNTGNGNFTVNDLCSSDRSHPDL